MSGHTDFYLQKKTVNGYEIEFRKCSSCGQKMIEGKEPYFNSICIEATLREVQHLNEIKKLL